MALLQSLNTSEYDAALQIKAVERQEFQKRVFENWINSKLKIHPQSIQVNNLFEDLKDGSTLLILIEVLTGRILKPVKGNMRLHHVNNLNIALSVLKEYKVKLVGIHSNSLADGDRLTTMGLCWNIMYRFQVVEAMKGHETKNAEKALLDWCQIILNSCTDIEVNSFQPSKWKDGYALNGIIHAFQPDMFHMNDLSKIGDAARLENAIFHAKNSFGVEPVFEANDIINDFVDSKTLVIYISQLYMKLSSLTPASKKGNDEIVCKVEQAISEELKFLFSKQDSTLLEALQNPTLKDLKKRYKNYNNFFKELEGAARRIDSVKTEYDYLIQLKNISSLDKERVTLSFEKLNNSFATLESNAKIARNAVQSKLVSHLTEQFEQVSKVIKQVKSDQESISKTLNDEQILMSEVQEKHLLCEKTMEVLLEMKPLVKLLNDLSEQLSRDQTINELTKKKLHQSGIDTKNEFEILVDSIQKLFKRSSTAVEEKKIKKQMDNWLSGVQMLQTWLKKSLQFKADFQLEEQLDKELLKIKACLSDVDAKWKEFLKLTQEWNEQLCDKVKNNQYAILQEDVQKDFTALHKMLVYSSNQCELIIKEKIKKDQSNILQEWKSLFNPKYDEMTLLKNSFVRHPMEMDINSAKIRKRELEEYENKINNHEREIELLMESKLQMNKKKGFSVEIETSIESDIEVIQSLLENNQNTVEDFKKLFADDYLQLKKKQNDAFVHLIKKCKIVLEWIQENEADIKKFMEMDSVFGCTKEVQFLVGEILKYHQEVEKILNEGDRALNSNYFGKKKANEVNIQMLSLAKKWDKLSDSVQLLEQKYMFAMTEKFHLSTFKDKIKLLMEYVEEKMHQFHIINKEVDSKVALVHLENLMRVLQEKDADFKSIHVDLKSLQTKNTISETVLSLINTELEVVDKSWQNLCEEFKDAILRLKIACERESDLEKQTLKGWSKMAKYINEWLEHAELLIKTYSDLPNDLESLLITIQKFEEILIKLNTEETTVNEQLDYGQMLIENKSFKKSYIDELTEEINDFKIRKQSINRSTQHQQSRMKELLEELLAIEQAEFTSWIEQASIEKQKLEDFDTKEEDTKTVGEATKASMKMKEVLSKLSSYEADLEALFVYGNALLKNKKLGENKSNLLNKEMKEIKEKWDILNKILTERKKHYEENLLVLQSQSNSQIISLVDKMKAYCNWLDFIKAQLDDDSCRRSNKISVLLNQEQGLKKHSSDLESKANEFEDIIKLAENILLEIIANELNHQDVEQLLHQLKGKWSSVVDQIDAQFRSLYDEINSSLDSKRAQIVKMLHILKNNLNEEFLNDDQQSIKRNINRLEELGIELSKLERPVSKLFEHTVLLSDVTIVMDNDKLVLMQSCDDLIKEYRHCVHLYEDKKKNQQNIILQYFTQEKESITNRLQQINKMKFPLNEHNLKFINLKQYYSSCQIWLSEIGKEKAIIEELNGFANEVSTFLPNKMLVTQIVGDAFKDFDFTKSIYDNVYNRIKVLMLHMLNEALQKNFKEIKEIKEKSTNLEKKELKEFEHAAVLLMNLKDVEVKGNQVLHELESINNQLNEFKECFALDTQDYQRMQENRSELSNDMQLLSSTLTGQREKFVNFINDLILNKLDVFWGWLPIIKKRSCEGVEVIGPEITALKKQLHEMKVIDQQINEKSFTSFLSNSDISINNVLNKDLVNEVNSANEEWNGIMQWASKRKELLNYALQKWEEFTQSKKDLLDYLQENDKDLSVWNQIDLNDATSVESKLKLLENITNAMQRRREHVLTFNSVSDELLAVIGDDMNEVNNVLSQVADVHDFWNRVVKNTIGYTRKLQKYRQMVLELEHGINVVDDWLTLTSSLLEIVSEDLEIPQLEAILIEIKEKDGERNKIREHLDSVNDWYNQLDGSEDTRSHFSVHKSIDELNEEFTNVIESINNLNNLRGKGKILWYRLKGNFHSAADVTSNTMNSAKEGGVTLFGRFIERTASMFKSERKAVSVNEE